MDRSFRDYSLLALSSVKRDHQIGCCAQDCAELSRSSIKTIFYLLQIYVVEDLREPINPTLERVGSLTNLLERAVTDYLELLDPPVLDTNIRSPIATCQSRYIHASRIAITLKASAHVFCIIAIST